MVLKYVRRGDTDPFVPYLAVNFSTLLALASLGILIYFFHHVSINIYNVVATIGHKLVGTIDDQIEDNKHAAKQDKRDNAPSWETVVGSRQTRSIPADVTGYIQSIGHFRLVEPAEQYNVCLKLERRAGPFIMQGSPLLTYTPAVKVREEFEEAALEGFIFRQQRSPVQNIEYLIDQINQVAARALTEL
ncbi:MAG TPA: DUF2254 family protein, partial [Gammaproteobacteria bacterium]|nr:DUF2254 family protein [Gammaproteobacteria bacterium]